MALRRLNSLWRRLAQDPKILELYRNFIHEYLEMGHMEKEVADEDSAIVYYLPHHGVYRQESKTTPLRVVFKCILNYYFRRIVKFFAIQWWCYTKGSLFNFIKL
ncbi:uncharacterized protein TNCV_2247151 [Trichonephila clavipes]|nr:uncharacterized protein TNCV_2247151 [Trichonephila clavipes]